MNPGPSSCSLPPSSIPPPPPLFTRGRGGADLFSELGSVATGQHQSGVPVTGVDTLTSLENTLESLANLLFALRQERRRIQSEKQQLNVEWAKFRRMYAGSYIRMYQAAAMQGTTPPGAETCHAPQHYPRPSVSSHSEAMRSFNGVPAMEVPTWTAQLDKMTARLAAESAHNGQRPSEARGKDTRYCAFLWSVLRDPLLLQPYPKASFRREYRSPASG
ncbi:hypothetical protein FOZ63_003554 [Perkinsus olseni]|uniref:Uncharacterized protein n=1 Tax=Perkinsus olseni TaxID=32597 RepID=A0A7J6SDH4_PEROL|nr:hypothetical protein FOZ63_003554 [Perkinsus olseni]